MRPSFRRTLLSAVLVMGATGACLSADDILVPELTIVPGTPEGWTSSSIVGGIGTTVSEQKSGAMAAYISSAGQQIPPNYLMVQYVRADNYRGKRLQLSGWFKPRNVNSAQYSGLWMRVDGPGTVLAFDDMPARQVLGRGDWRQVSVVLDVPENAIGIALGVQFRAFNTLLVDDLTLVEVATTVASTSLLTAPQTSDRDSATTVADYAERPLAPVNMDFEIVAAGGAAGGRSPSNALATTTRVNHAMRAEVERLERLRRLIR